ncbi:fluoride efflux transporter CrcB [Paenibacillus oenotherae]|uniref:Fluoride-specific ion channel FluC n=1 Tax=Paenibacillus oenotherae TaxID=1435645 RepID=A0ABS7D2Z7_9BACL|nr:fluoride efflux transporter CrcB [Paenibacillus oenotherae]MBW7474223.1 fluoride efflux transporter CrcB [Paenibacillus oenotherae]
MKVWAAVVIFGALGAISRYGISVWMPQSGSDGWPWATFVINVLGSLALGIILALAARYKLGAVWREGIGTGFLGAFTTFSAYSVETVRLVQAGNASFAVAYAASSIILGVGAALAGTVAASGTRSGQG